MKSHMKAQSKATPKTTTHKKTGVQKVAKSRNSNKVVRSTKRPFSQQINPSSTPTLKTYTTATRTEKSVAFDTEDLAPQPHTNHFGADKFYNPDDDSDFEPHYAFPPTDVAAFPFADKQYNFSIRFGQDPSKVHKLNIYEGETYWDAVHRQQLHFPDAKCLPSSTFLQEEQFQEGAHGCGGCIGQFPIGFKANLPPISQTELSTYQNFWEYRVNQAKTYRDGGSPDSIRFLCTLDFSPDMDGVEIYAPGTNHPYFDDVAYIKANDAAMV